ncbi:hypothetical protein FQN60_010638 [Etheostoma spectabile]|uniref:Uncharacterized protein n=1 Tax=Etheostoma spectabile TaxID=54343 RepID=A0A5J5CC51_9PERO|nr:hypothetical protein FQN60_010638 [Etheostoma spectabile]
MICKAHGSLNVIKNDNERLGPHTRKPYTWSARATSKDYLRHRQIVLIILFHSSGPLPCPRWHACPPGCPCWATAWSHLTQWMFQTGVRDPAPSIILAQIRAIAPALLPWVS